MAKQIHLLIFDDGREYRVEDAFLDKKKAQGLATRANEERGSGSVLPPQHACPYDVRSVNIVDYDAHIFNAVMGILKKLITKESISTA